MTCYNGLLQVTWSMVMTWPANKTAGRFCCICPGCWAVGAEGKDGTDVPGKLGMVVPAMKPCRTRNSQACNAAACSAPFLERAAPVNVWVGKLPCTSKITSEQTQHPLIFYKRPRSKQGCVRTSQKQQLHIIEPLFTCLVRRDFRAYQFADKLLRFRRRRAAVVQVEDRMARVQLIEL